MKDNSTSPCRHTPEPWYQFVTEFAYNTVAAYTYTTICKIGHNYAVPRHTCGHNLQAAVIKISCNRLKLLTTNFNSDLRNAEQSRDCTVIPSDEIFTQDQGQSCAVTPSLHVPTQVRADFVQQSHQIGALFHHHRLTRFSTPSKLS